ncbi:hypothetical protein U7230_06940 [Carboxydochorda subterranea]|uniref:Winged helix-turn-helix transcription repressor HrcA DNA-binding domain-containing protein n=1 Tax=Carboxydichorda subterranea TaxID=3109565 RepID=A0ABZ1C120_9FIRM|nr:hypothetical protein [Limnochorda sp. L945t]WRP18722.1 hypothetical protein U7230_06940 [Limnochorda sp. L945t]
MAGAGLRRSRGQGEDLTPLQGYILAHVQARCASGARVVPSRDLAAVFRISHAYAREQARALVLLGLLEVRPGRAGGYRPRSSKPSPAERSRPR